MRHFIAFLLMIVLSVANFAQDEKPKPQQAKPKIAGKTKKVSKIKPKAKPKPKVTVIEAATKDGKPVTLKSNGTWEYVKTEADAKPSPSPAPAPKPSPSVKPTPSANPNPVTKPTPAVVAEKSPVPKPAPNAKTTAYLLSKECDLSLKDSPVIRGLKLGMPREEADRVIPSDRVRYIDSSAITAYPQFSRTAGFENVYQISAYFSEEKLGILEIVYDPNAVKWSGAKEYAENLSQNFTLPFRFWKFNAKTPAIAEMRCSEFSITIDSEQNEIRLEKQNPVQKTAQTKEETKKVFKP